MTREYDVAVIGSGVAGGVIATQCRAAGLKVAVTDSRDFGGTCPLRGCNPKKVLMSAAEVIHRSRDMIGKGVAATCEVRWPELMRFKRTFTDPVPERVENEFKEKGIDAYHESARFTGRNSLRVGDGALTANTIAICSGAAPRELGVEGEEHLISSDQFLELQRLPDSVVFIGGGYISFEFAHIAARAGVKVDILEATGAVLTPFDRDLVDILTTLSKEIGIRLHLNLPLDAVEKRGDRFAVRAGDGVFECGLVVKGAGRVANVDALDLEKGQVERSPRGVAVNEYMQSVSNPSVYAAGDAAATPFPLTPTALLEGNVAATNIINGNTAKADHTGVPSVVFTLPPLAAAGMSEDQVRQSGFEYEARFQDTSSWFSSKRIGLKHSGAKILVEKGSEKILGAHILGHHAEEVINVFAMAIRLGLTARDLKRVVWSYPTSVYEMKHLLD